MTEKGPHFCEEVRGEVRDLASKVDRILEKTHCIDTNVEILRNRESPPCREYLERITKLEETRTVLRNGWVLIGIIFGGLVGLGSLIMGGIVVWKSF